MQNENKPAPENKTERTTPLSSTTEMPARTRSFKKVMSQRQIEANRANAARSKGRKSPEGLQRSARNALKHGLCAADVRLVDPCPHAAEEHTEAVLYDELLRDLAPATPDELVLARRIVAGFRGLQRLLAFERDAVRRTRDAALDPASRTKNVLPVGEDFERLLLYQSRISGRLHRAIEKYLLLRDSGEAANA